MGLQCVRHDATPRADDTVEWGRGQCERDEGVWRCESGAGLVRQRDLHMTRHGGCQESAARIRRREHAHVCCLHCAVDGPGSMCAHHMHFDDRTWRGTVAQSLLYYAITPRARARPTATTPTECAGLEVRGVAVETQSAVVHFGVCHARAWGSDVAWTSAGRVGARHVPMWRRGRPRRSASTTHRCAGSLGHVSTSGRAAHRQPSYRETFESRIFFALHQ